MTDFASRVPLVDVIAQQLDAARLYAQAGLLPQALSLYRTVLQSEPRNLDALRGLAQLCIMGRDHTGALATLKQILRAQPRDAFAHALAGRCHKALGNANAAVRAYRESLRLQPEQAETEVSLGIALRASGDTDGAERAYRRAIRIDPELAVAHHNLANLLLTQGRGEQSRELYEQALHLQPRLGETHVELGNLALLRAQGAAAIEHYGAAVAAGFGSAKAALTAGKNLLALRERVLAQQAFAQAFRLAPNDQEVLFQHGRALYEQHDFDGAIRMHACAVQMAPDFADAYVNLAASLRGGGRHDEAAECYVRALSLEPSLPAAELGLAMLDWDFHRIDDAHDRLLRLVNELPDYVDAWLMLTIVNRELNFYGAALETSAITIALNAGLAQAHSNEATIRLQMGDVQSALTAFERSVQLDPAWAEGGQVAVTPYNYIEADDPARVLEAHRSFGQRHFRPVLPWANKRTRPRLRIGYLSPDLFSHSVSYFIEPLLAHHDKLRFEVYCYHLGRVVDDTTARLRGHVEHWLHCHEHSDAQLHKALLADELDVLVDCAGHTRGSRLRVLGARAAPLQALWLGYPTTSGLPSMDLRISDPVVDPEGYDVFSTERVLRLPNSYYCYLPPADAPAEAPPPCVRTGVVTFGSFNNLPKLSDLTIDMWSELLRTMPNARLLIKSAQLADAAVSTFTLERFSRRGIDGGRVTLLGRVKAVCSHLELYADVDIALDTFPYNGATTTCEALWMGVPVVTLCGKPHAARMAASILNAAGRSQWITRTPEEYIATCAALAADVDALARTRRQLREHLRTSVLMDAARFAAGFEAVLEQAVSADQLG